MSNISFRISLSFSDVNLGELYALCDKVVIYEHPADSSVSRTHIHGLLIGCKRKEDTIRNRFFKGIYEKSDYSINTKNVSITFITYMSKGKYVPSYTQNVTPDVIELYTNAWIPKGEKPVVNLVCFRGKLVPEFDENKKKLTKRQLIEVMMIKYNDNMDVETVLHLIREVLMAHNEVLGRWKCMDFYDALLMYADEDRWMDGIVSQINKRDKKI